MGSVLNFYRYKKVINQANFSHWTFNFHFGSLQTITKKNFLQFSHRVPSTKSISCRGNRHLGTASYAHLFCLPRLTSHFPHILTCGRKEEQREECCGWNERRLEVSGSERGEDAGESENRKNTERCAAFAHKRQRDRRRKSPSQCF